jgi:integrase
MATIDERTGIKRKTYTARVRYKGEEYTETFKSKTKAANWAKKMERAIDDGTSMTMESTQTTVNAVLDEYEASLDKTDDGYKKRISHLKVWRSKIGKLKLSKVTPALLCKIRRLIRFVPTNRGDSRSPATVNRYMSALSAAFTYAVEELHCLKMNPVRQIKRLTENPPPVRFLDQKKELPKLMEACAKSENLRLLPLFMTAICLGLRAGAILWLHRDEIDLDDRSIRIPAERSKNDRAFTLGISDVHYPHIKYLVENCHPESGLLFPALTDPFKCMDYRNDWDEALRLAGIENYRFHDNRHTCGSYLAMAGYSLTDIAELLNHKTLEMAKRYSHVADEYRKKISGKMHNEFISGVAIRITNIPGLDHPAVSHAINIADAAETSNKPHLRRVK